MFCFDMLSMIAYSAYLPSPSLPMHSRVFTVNAVDGDQVVSSDSRNCCVRLSADNLDKASCMFYWSYDCFNCFICLW